MKRTPPSLLDRLAGLVDKLLGQSDRPVPAYVPVAARRPYPVRVRVQRR